MLCNKHDPVYNLNWATGLSFITSSIQASYFSTREKGIIYNYLY